jgi:hypothetical protein
VLYSERMPKRSLTEKPVRKLTRMGGGRSLGIVLPIEFIRKIYPVRDPKCFTPT